MKKLLKVQSELKAGKDLFNKFGGYAYRSCESILEALKPLLVKHDLLLTMTDEVLAVGNRIYVRATATLKDDGESLSVFGWAREEDVKKGMDACQITGSASSYARKYALNAMFLIDDAKDSDSTNDHGKGEKAEPKEEPQSETMSVEGKVEKIGTPNKGGYVPITLLGCRLDDGTEIKFTTKDPAVLKLMEMAKAAGTPVKLEGVKTEYKGYVSVTKAEDGQTLPF